MATIRILIPSSVRAEHAAIHAALVEATQAPGRTGQAARDVAHILHPHFLREEEIALPPLSLLAPLAARDMLPDEALAAALAMCEALAAELPRMLQEHQRIRAAVENLRSAAHAEGAIRAERLAEQLALHAEHEEQVLYPAVILLAETIRARRGK